MRSPVGGAGLKNAILPFARAARLQGRYRRSQLRAALGVGSQRSFTRPPVFIVACGRSGTTLLGELLALHPRIDYLFEPYHLWTAVDPRTDMTHLFTRSESSCALTGADVSDRTRRRFAAVFGRCVRPDAQLVEKTPINALRLGYLDALAPDAKYIHILRDGVEVARSIDRVASENSYRIAGMSEFNQWWGCADIKWRLLARDGAALGCAPEAVQDLITHEERGAYEWLLSAHAIERHRSALGERLLEIRYADLLSDPADTLGRIAGHMDLDAPAHWLNDCKLRIRAGGRSSGAELRLPVSLTAPFNAAQSRYGFAGRALPTGEGAETSPSRIADVERRLPDPIKPIAARSA